VLDAGNRIDGGAEPDPIEFSWSSSDVQLYHLGLGAGADPIDQRELRYLVDDTPQVLSTFGNVAQTFHITRPHPGTSGSRPAPGRT
jgi:hypothetical protein